MNEDMSQYLGLFLDEASEQLELLERDILLLESEPSPELLGGIFRAAHTLKGSSRAMGFTAMGELTHAMEDVFDRLRQNTLTITHALIDALFAALDSLKVMREEIATVGQTQTVTEELCTQLRAHLDGGTEPGTEAKEPENAQRPTPDTLTPHFPHLDVETEALLRQALGEEGATAYWLEMEFAPDCLMKSIRAMLAMNAMNELGQVLITEPGGDLLETDEFPTPLFFLVQTTHTEEEIRASFAHLSETELIRLTEWKTEPVHSLRIPEMETERAQNEFRFSLTMSQEEAIAEVLSEGGRLVCLRVRLDEDCVMKSIRALMTLNALESVGSVIALNPTDEILEAEEFDLTFEVLLAAQSDDASIRKTIQNISEACCDYLGPWENMGVGCGVSGVGTPTPEPKASPPVTKEPENAQRPTPAVAPARHPTPHTATPPQAQTVRVDVSRLDNLLNLIGELVIDRTRIAQLGSLIERKYGSEELIENLSETAAHIGRITDELQSEIMKARLLPIDNVFNRFPRMMRDLAQKLGKEIEFIVEGKETELDRSVIEIIGDPLVHMLRNSVDHGIEMPEERKGTGKSPIGTVWLRARHQENHIVIEIEDDGKGMSPAALRMLAVKKGLMTEEAAFRLTDKEALMIIFAPGFSTAAVVSEVSGRGVGMDIVKSNLERLGAAIEIASEPGKGSRFTIKLPLTLAIIRGLLVRVAQSVFALPLVSVQETLRVPVSALHRVNGREVVLQRGTTLPVVRLGEIFSLETAVVRTPQESGISGFAAGIQAGSDSADNVSEPKATLSDGLEITEENRAIRPDEIYLVVVGNGDGRVGLVVDYLIGEQEIVIKTLGKFIGEIPGISGATILGDGRVALIADVNGIIEVAIERAQERMALSILRREEMGNAA